MSAAMAVVVGREMVQHEADHHQDDSGQQFPERHGSDGVREGISKGSCIVGGLLEKMPPPNFWQASPGCH